MGLVPRDEKPDRDTGDEKGPDEGEGPGEEHLATTPLVRRPVPQRPKHQDGTAKVDDQDGGVHGNEDDPAGLEDCGVHAPEHTHGVIQDTLLAVPHRVRKPGRAPGRPFAAATVAHGLQNAILIQIISGVAQPRGFHGELDVLLVGYYDVDGRVRGPAKVISIGIEDSLEVAWFAVDELAQVAGDGGTEVRLGPVAQLLGLADDLGRLVARVFRDAEVNLETNLSDGFWRVSHAYVRLEAREPQTPDIVTKRRRVPGLGSRLRELETFLVGVLVRVGGPPVRALGLGQVRARLRRRDRVNVRLLIRLQ